MTQVEARKLAEEVIRDEANSLACVLNDEGKVLPHRAQVAIQREIQRFREIADALKDPTKT